MDNRMIFGESHHSTTERLLNGVKKGIDSIVDVENVKHIDKKIYDDLYDLCTKDFQIIQSLIYPKDRDVVMHEIAFRMLVSVKKLSDSIFLEGRPNRSYLTLLFIDINNYMTQAS